MCGKWQCTIYVIITIIINSARIMKFSLLKSKINISTHNFFMFVVNEQLRSLCRVLYYYDGAMFCIKIKGFYAI